MACLQRLRSSQGQARLEHGSSLEGMSNFNFEVHRPAEGHFRPQRSNGGVQDTLAGV